MTGTSVRSRISTPHRICAKLGIRYIPRVEDTHNLPFTDNRSSFIPNSSHYFDDVHFCLDLIIGSNRLVRKPSGSIRDAVLLQTDENGGTQSTNQGTGIRHVLLMYCRVAV
ncbi:hypothetical protein BDV93DRAFT_515010 [Ceratobasidium sp. AG-I]|nr:hypothetical protein BDV93DRAFT_515010 [Ceratobasidium sp. AG-I]